MTGNKLFTILLFLLFSQYSIANEKTFQQLELLCLTKLKIIDWVLNYGNQLPLDEKINVWEYEFKKLNFMFPSIFTHTTKIDTERIIRESERLKEKLKDANRKQKFIEEEIRWCLYYKN